MATPYISMAGIGKSFGPVHALKSVNLTVYHGEIHALLGENGAGKSTLMKVLSGIHEPTKGTITINNINYNKLDHKLAAQLGIGIIYQELSVIDELTVLENLYIGRHLTKKICGVNIIDWREMRVRAAMMLLRVGLKVDLDEKVANLSISHKQMLEIAKTLMLDAKVIIMDEPTSSLTNKAGLDPDVPYNYFPHNDPQNKPRASWRSHGNLLFTNWLNYYVYQITPYDLRHMNPTLD